MLHFGVGSRYALLFFKIFYGINLLGDAHLECPGRFRREEVIYMDHPELSLKSDDLYRRRKEVQAILRRMKVEGITIADLQAAENETALPLGVDSSDLVEGDIDSWRRMMGLDPFSDDVEKSRYRK